jgi:hypothetical protein
MAPPSAIHTSETADTGASIPSNGHEDLGTATHEPGLTKSQAEKAEVVMPKFPGVKKFAYKYEEREYQKGRLALAFRIFAKLGFDEGVAGHITLRVSLTSWSKDLEYGRGEKEQNMGALKGGASRGMEMRKMLTIYTYRILLNLQVFGLIPLVSRGHF